MGYTLCRHTIIVRLPQVTGFVRVVLPFLKPATFALGEIIVTPKVGTREMGFIMSGEVEVNCGLSYRGRILVNSRLVGQYRCIATA